MKTVVTFSVVFLIFAIIVVPCASAKVISAVTCSQLDVQASVNIAADGDVVSMPAGSCTWSSAVSWRDKNISLIGAGIDKTIITANNNAVSVVNTNKSSFRISGLTFTGSPTSNPHIIKLTSEYNKTGQKGWRIDHVRFNYPSCGSPTPIYIAGINWGLIDHCVFDGSGYVSIILDSYVDGEWSSDPLLSKMGNAAWALPLNLGSDEAVYIENNAWNFNGSGCSVSAVFDMYDGGRVVFRNNNVVGTYAETHATRGAGRGGLKYEVYNNAFVGNGFIWPMMFRSGTGVIFNNSISGYKNNNIVVDNQRTCIAYANTKYSRCDGSNAYDGNTSGEYGWPCTDQIGRGSGVASGSRQPSIPLYSWGNGSSIISVNGDFDLCLTSLPKLSTHIKPTPHTNGEVDFVNNGVTSKPGYIPYIYPHPLQADDTRLSPPVLRLQL